MATSPSYEVLEQLEQQQTLIAQLKHLVRENEQELKNKEKQLEDTSSKFKKFKLQSRAKMNQLSSQVKESTKDKDDEAEGSTNQSMETSDQGSRAKVILLKKQLEETKQRFEKQEQSMKDHITCLQSTVQQLEETKNGSDLSATESSIKLQIAESKNSQPYPDKGTQELYAQIVYKDSKILDLNNQILELERRLMDLQEHIREKDEVLSTRNIAIQLMKEDLNRRGQSVTNELAETRQEMRNMQERFASAESTWLEEKTNLQIQRETIKENECQQLQQEVKNSEATRFDLAKRNAELQEKVVHLQESLQALGNSQQDNTNTLDQLKKQLSVKDQQYQELKKSFDEATSTTDNRILKARAKERSKLKASERQMEELKKNLHAIEKGKTDLETLLNASKEENSVLNLKIGDLQQQVEEKINGVQDVDQKMIQMQSELNQHVFEIAALVKDKEEMLVEIENLNKDIEKNTNFISDLESSLSNSHSNVKTLEERIEVLNAEKVSAEQFINQLQSIEKSVSEQKNTFEELKTSHNSIDSCLKEIFNLCNVENFEAFNLKWTEQKDSLLNLKDYLERSHEENSSLNNYVLEKEEHIKSLKEQGQTYLNQISQLELSLEDAMTKEKLSEDKITALLEENQLIENDKQSVLLKVGTMERENETLRNQFEVVENCLKNLNLSINIIFELCGVDNVDSFKEIWAVQQEEISKLKIGLQEHIDQVRSLSAIEERLSSMITELNQSKGELSVQYSNVVESLHDKSCQLKALEEFHSCNSQEIKSKEDAYMERFTLLQAELDTSERTIQEKLVQEQEHIKNIEALNHLNQTIKDELEACQEALTNKDSEIVNQTEKHTILTNKHEELLSYMKNLQKELLLLQENLDKSNHDQSIVEENYQKVLLEVSELSNQLFDINNENSILKNDSQITFEHLSSEKLLVSTLQNEANIIRNETESIRAELNSVKDSWSKEQSEHCQIKELCEVYKQKIESIDLQNSELIQKITNLESTKLNMQSQVQELQDELQRQKDSYNEFKNDRQLTQSELELKCDSMIAEIEALSTQKNEVKSLLNNVSSEQDFWKEKCSVLTTTISELNTQLFSVTNQVSLVTKQNEQLVQELSSVMQDKENINTTLQHAEELNDTFLSSVRSVEEHLQEQIHSVSKESKVLFSILNKSAEYLKEIALSNGQQTSHDVSSMVLFPIEFTFNPKNTKDVNIDSNLYNIEQMNILKEIKCDTLNLKTLVHHIQDFISSFNSNTKFLGILKNENKELVKSVGEYCQTINNLKETNNNEQIENGNLVRQIEELQSKNAGICEELQTVQSNFEEVNNNLKDLQSNYEFLNTSMSSTSDQIQSLETLKGNLEVELVNHKTEISSLSEIIQSQRLHEQSQLSKQEDTKKQMAILQEKLDYLKTEVVEQNDEIHRLHLIEDNFHKVSSNLSALEEELQISKTKNNDLIERIQSFEHQVVNLNDLITGLQQSSSDQVTELHSSNYNLKELSDTLKHENSVLRKQISSLEENVSSQKQEHTSFLENYKSLENTCSENESEFLRLKESKDSLELEFSQTKSELERCTKTFQERVKVLENQLDTIANSYKDLEQSTRNEQLNFNSDLEQAKECAKEYEETLQNVQKDFSVIQEEKDSLVNELVVLKDELSNLNKLVMEKDELLVHVHQTLDEKCNEFENLKKRSKDLLFHSESTNENIISELNQSLQNIDLLQNKIQNLTTECQNFQEEVSHTQSIKIELETAIEELNRQLSLNSDKLKERDEEIETIKEMLNDKTNKFSNLLKESQSAEDSHLNLKSTLEEVQRAIIHFQTLLQEKTVECDKLTRNELELKNQLSENLANTIAKEDGFENLQLTVIKLAEDIKNLQLKIDWYDNELSSVNEQLMHTVNTSLEKDANIKLMLEQQTTDTDIFDTKMSKLLSFESVLLKSIKDSVNSIGSSTYENDNLTICFNSISESDLDLSDSYQGVIDLQNLFQIKHETIVNLEEKLDHRRTCFNSLITLLAVNGMNPEKSMDSFRDEEYFFENGSTNFCQIVEQQIGKFKRHFDETEKTSKDVELQLKNALDKIEMLSSETQELRNKNQLVDSQNHATNSNPSLKETIENSVVHTGPSTPDPVNYHNDDNDETKNRFEIIKVENQKQKSLIDANKLKMGKMLMKLKQFKEKIDLLNKELQEFENTKSLANQYLVENQELNQRITDLNEKLEVFQSSLNGAEEKLRITSEENNNIKELQVMTETQLENVKIVFQQQAYSLKETLQEKENQNSCLLSQLQVTKQQCDTISSDNDTFLTLIEELKLSKKQTEVELVKVRTSLSQEQNEKNNLSRDLGDRIEQLKAAIYEKDDLLLSTTHQLSTKKDQQDKMTQDYSNLQGEFAKLKNTQVIRLSEIKELKAELSEKDDKISNIFYQLSQEKEQLDKMKQDYSELQEEFTKIRNIQIVSLSDAFTNQVQAKEDSTHTRAPADNISKESDLVDVEEELCIKTTIGDLQSENSGLSARVAELEELCAKLENDKLSLETMFAKFKSDLAENSENFQRKMTILESELFEKNQEIKELQEKIEILNLTVANVQQSMESEKLQRTLLESSREDISSRCHTLESNIGALVFERDNLITELQVESSKRDSLERLHKEANSITICLQSQISLLITEKDRLIGELQEETDQREALQSFHEEVKKRESNLQANLVSLNEEKSQLQRFLHDERVQRESLARSQEDLRNYHHHLSVEKEALDAKKFQDQKRDDEQRDKEEHLSRELQQTMKTIHQQGLRCQELNLELSQVLEERDTLREQLLHQQRLSKSPIMFQVENESLLRSSNSQSIEEVSVEAQKKLEIVQAELEQERHRRLLLQEELSKDSLSKFKYNSDEEYKLIIEEEPVYIPETNHLISRNVQTHWTKLHRWLLGRRDTHSVQHV